MPIARVLAPAACWLFALSACDIVESRIDQRAAEDRAEIETQVARDAIAQYEIVKRGGDVAAMCTHAGIVAEAFVQAKDEKSYKIWRETQKSDCARAEAPR